MIDAKQEREGGRREAKLAEPLKDETLRCPLCPTRPEFTIHNSLFTIYYSGDWSLP